jgi:hypothetical protein
MRCPNLFLIGSQKSGSSSLFKGLAAHPGIDRMTAKEPNIFCAPSEAEARAELAKYQPAESTGRYLIDASVNYTRHPKFADVPERIAEIVPDLDAVRFIYILRNPVERLVSNYFFKAQRYGTPDDLLAAVEADPQYVATGLYDQQVRRYYRWFAPEQFRFVKFETFSADPAAELARLFEWLGLEPLASAGGVRAGATDKELTRVPRSGALTRTLWAVPGLRATARRLLPDRTIRRLSRALTRDEARRDPPREIKRRLLETHFLASIHATGQLTGLDLQDWLHAYDAPPADVAAPGAMEGQR